MHLFSPSFVLASRFSTESSSVVCILSSLFPYAASVLSPVTINGHMFPFVITVASYSNITPAYLSCLQQEPYRLAHCGLVAAISTQNSRNSSSNLSSIFLAVSVFVCSSAFIGPLLQTSAVLYGCNAGSSGFFHKQIYLLVKSQ